MGQEMSVVSNISENDAFIFRTEIHDNLEYYKEYYYRILGKKVLREKKIIYKNGNIKKTYHILNFTIKDLDDFIDRWKKTNVSFINAYNHPILLKITNSKRSDWVNVRCNINI